MAMNLRFPDGGLLKVENTFVLGDGRQLYQTEHGFFFNPREPLRDKEVVEKLPANLREAALSFIDENTVPPEVEETADATVEEPVKASDEPLGSDWKRSGKRG
jgi:hypothetical protein